MSSTPPPTRRASRTATPANASFAPKRYKTTPLPMRQLVPMTFVLLNEAMGGSMIQPFIGLFIAFLQKKPPEEAGYLAGVIASVFMVGQVLSARMWGWLSDEYGRRLPLIAGLFTSGIFMLLFGLSSQVWLCAVWRFFYGLFNGNVLVAKTMMADITDKTNEASGFAFVSLCSGFGFLIGPALGGILYDPTETEALRWLHLDKNGIFAHYPALLPSICMLLYSLVGVLVCTFFVQESNPRAKPIPNFVKVIFPCLLRKADPFVAHPLREIEPSRSNSVVYEGAGTDAAASDLQREDTRIFDNYIVEEITDFMSTPYIHDHESDDGTLRTASETVPSPTAQEDGVRGRTDGRAKNEPPTTPPPSPRPPLPSDERKLETDGATIPVETNNARAGDEAPQDQASPASRHGRTFGYRQAFSIPQIRFMLVQYMLLCAGDVIMRQSLPLWAIAKISVGGLHYTSDEVGYVLLMNSIPSFTSNYYFHKVFKRYRNKIALFRVGFAFAALATLLMPFTSYIRIAALQFIVLAFFSCVEQFFCSWSYSLNTLLTARAAPVGQVGAIMGINQSCGALTRGFVPLIMSPLFAWSISGNHIYPFDFQLVFVISTAVFIFCWWRSYAIRTNREGKLEMVDDDDDEAPNMVVHRAVGQIRGLFGRSTSQREQH